MRCDDMIEVPIGVWTSVNIDVWDRMSFLLGSNLTFSYWPSTDLPGSDLAAIFNIDLRACRNWCIGVPWCRGYVAQQLGAFFYCWTKSSATNPKTVMNSAFFGMAVSCVWVG